MTMVYDSKDMDITKLVNSDSWKDRIKAAMLISEIEDREEIKKRIVDIFKLLRDENLLVRINMINSLKKLILKYPDILKPLIPEIHALAHTKNKMLASNVKSLIELIPPQLIQEVVIDATNKLYSANGLDRAVRLWILSTISLTSPEYLKNSLPELMATSINDRYELLQMFALSIIEEFKEKEMSMVLDKLNMIFPCHIVKSDWSLDSESYDELIYALMKRYFGKITKDDLKKVLNFIDYKDLLVKLLSIAILKENAEMLWEILDDWEIETLIAKLMKNLNSRYWTVKTVSLLSLAEILTSCTRDKEPNWNESIERYLSTLVLKSSELLRISFITKAYALDALAIIYKRSNSPEVRTKIEELIENVNIKEILKEHYISYFKGISLIVKLKGEDIVNYLTPEIHPYIDIDFIEELRSENPLNYGGIFREIELGANSDDWLDRCVNIKLLGNALYALPSFAEVYAQQIKALLTDPVWMTRSTSVWALRIVNYVKGLNFTKEDYLDLFEYADDWYWTVRWEYLMLFLEVIKKDPEILEDDGLRNALLSVITTKYLTDKSHTIRKMCRYILQKIPGTEEILNYFSKDYASRYKILQSMVENPALRKSAFIRLKIRLRKAIKSNNEEMIKRLLEFVNGKYYKETSYILHELVLLYDKYKIAKDMVDTIKAEYPEIIQHRMDLLHRMLSELIVVKRRSALRELKAYVEIGIPITEKILNRLKEMVVYDVVDPTIVKLTIYILEKVGDDEAKQLIKERKELIDVGKDYSLELGNVLKGKSATWHSVYGLIEHMPDDRLLNLDLDLMELLHILSKKDTGIILKVRIIDFIIRTIKTDDENFSKVIEDNYDDIFNIIFELMNCEYYLVSERATRLMKTILLKYPLLFRRWIFKKLSRSENNKKYIALVKKLLEDPNPDIKLEGLYVIECLINREYSDMACSFIYEMLGALGDEKWEVKKKSLDLILSLDINDEEIVDNIVYKIIKLLKLKDTEEDFKIYLLRLLNQLPTSKKYCKEVLDVLSEFKESHDPYIAEIAKSIIKKYSKENSEVDL
ncbi:HEAT repeat domain-containing protein [Methanotorris igneus]|uniref:Condensin complex subunit 1 C-terminal domain-containing protein n=1 Tax=Methanotorris igneus (strain DSM 5666 / JCM 11834 / Kol 5) TaxID=880724 RepID=F6BBA6_METIK|nr:HEAT repeat domain-containing protein [Methanotorris igneus]AEF97113.1 hypothetical protein Metig_1580 [Methanotorris igneus Kol 5]